jgi:hypothetical protein
VCIKDDATERPSGHRDAIAQTAKLNQQKTRHQKQPARTIHQEKAQRTPTITKCFEVRWVSLATVGMQGDGNLGNAAPREARFDDHFGGKFHAGTALLQTLIEGFRKAT